MYGLLVHSLKMLYLRQMYHLYHHDLCLLVEKVWHPVFMHVSLVKSFGLGASVWIHGQWPTRGQVAFMSKKISFFSLISFHLFLVLLFTYIFYFLTNLKSVAGRTTEETCVLFSTLQLENYAALSKSLVPPRFNFLNLHTDRIVLDNQYFLRTLFY